MKLAEMEKKMEEFMATERSARVQLAKDLEMKLVRLMQAETTALEATLEISVDEAKQAIGDEFEEFRQQVTDMLEEKGDEPTPPPPPGGLASISLGLRTFWNESTLPTEADDGRLWVHELLPVYRKWIKQTRYPPASGTSQFVVFTKLLIEKGSIRSLALDEHLEKQDETGKLRKRTGFVGRRIAPIPI